VRELPQEEAGKLRKTFIRYSHEAIYLKARLSPTIAKRWLAFGEKGGLGEAPHAPLAGSGMSSFSTAHGSSVRSTGAPSFGSTRAAYYL
jgi:hypothetical protein